MKKSVFLVFALIYIITAIWLLFFFPFTHASRLDHTVQRFVNPVPFQTTLEYFYQAWKYKSVSQIMELLTNVGGNILLFVPMGILMFNANPGKKRWWLPLLLGGLISFTVETIQITTQLGNFDIDDILLNMLGTVLGAWLASRTPLLQVELVHV